MKLEMEGQQADVSFQEGKVMINGRGSRPKRASLDVKRVLPMFHTVIIIIAIVFGFMMIGSLIGRVDVAIISVALGFGIATVVYFALSRVEQVLQVETDSGRYEFKGDDEDLRRLYYKISKVTIKRMKEKERTRSESYKGAGVTRGESYLKGDDYGEVKGDLKKSVLVGNRMVTQICPECGNDELYYEGGLMTGHVYHCKRCDYVGSFVLEKELDMGNKKEK